MLNFTKENPPTKNLLEGAIENMRMRISNKHPEHIEYQISLYALEQELKSRYPD